MLQILELQKKVLKKLIDIVIREGQKVHLNYIKNSFQRHLEIQKQSINLKP